MNFMNNLVFMDLSYSRWNSLISFSTVEEHHEAFLRFYVTILFALLFNRKTLLSMVQWFVKISTQVPKRCQWNQSAGLVLWDPKDAAAQSRQVFLLPQLFQQPLLFPHRHWSCTMDPPWSFLNCKVCEITVCLSLIIFIAAQIFVSAIPAWYIQTFVVHIFWKLTIFSRGFTFHVCIGNL